MIAVQTDNLPGSPLLAAVTPSSTATIRRGERIARWVLTGGSIFAAIVIAITLMHGLTRGLDYASLIHALRKVKHIDLLWSVCWTAVSFAALIGRDAGALRYVRAKPSVGAILLAGFCGTALGNAVGFGTLTGGAVRYRIYGAAGLKPDDVARAMLFIAGGFFVGLAGLGAVATLIEADTVGRLLGWSGTALTIASITVLVATIGFIVLCAHGQGRFGRFAAVLPSTRLALAQIALTGVDLLGASAALWVLLPAHAADFGSFTVIFIAATALSVISHVPGGLGVFEAVVLFALGRKVPPDLVGAALLAYRGVYFLLPLLLSALLLAGFEVSLLSSGRVSRAGLRLARAATRLSPTFLGVLTFAAGTMLIISGATPAFGHRLALLSLKLPLWIVETSHLLGSLAGVLLLFIARGLFHRLDGAWWLALVVTATSLALSLAKGLAYGEATALAFLLILLIATRRQFGRRASLLGQPFTVGWFVAVGLVLVASFSMLLFAFRDVAYSRDLWWQFEFDAQAPRALRAELGMGVLALALGLWQLLQLAPGRVARPTDVELDRATAILRSQEQSEGLLALMGDKSLIFSASGYAFLMFAKRGRSWIALNGPIGPRTEWPELIWRFVELASVHGGRAAFYQVRPDSLPLYLDAGLKIMKLGEDARVALQPFSLKGSDRSHLRYALKRGERDGLTFELLAAGQTASIWPSLRRVSADWLSARRTVEKSFSVAAFERRFVAAQSVAIVRQAGQVVAFATVMTTDIHREATIGLMRHARTASAYAMEFLFTRLILELKAAHYETLSLGMAPLSGFEPWPLSSRWHRLGALIWRHGNMLYNFQGLRLFKGKFSPVWEPRYLAASGTVGPFVALADVAALAGTPIKTAARA